MKHSQLLCVGLCLFLLGCVADAPDPKPVAATNKEASTEHEPHDEADGTQYDADPPADAKPYQVKFETSAGDFVVEVEPKWAPRAAARFRELVESGHFNDAKFFRSLKGFVAQFGLPADPKVAQKWEGKNLRDEPPQMSNTRGTLSFAKTDMPNTRSTQVFINFGDNSQLDGMGFAPFAKVISGMNVVDAINTEYGERPQQDRITHEGNAYLNKQFPKLTTITKATILSGDAPAAEETKKESEPAITDPAPAEGAVPEAKAEAATEP